ncbi:MAG: filamentous hemagglutinin N-terminal domain-containing protein [Cypionkella sp.]
MNHIFRSLWNESSGTFVAASEIAKSGGKKSSATAGSGFGGSSLRGGFALKTLACSLLLVFGLPAYALPVNGVVVAGNASIAAGAGNLTVTQTSQNAALNWQSFNIGAAEAVKFVQPNSSSVALNRVLGSDPSRILGSLTANGKVFLVNPNGIVFGKGASVNVGGLVASSRDILNSDFMAGRYKFDGTGNGAVLNQGTINAPDGGYVALLGANVSNEGVIAARLGTVALAAGKAMTLDVAGDGLLNIAIDQGAVNALVHNGGLIKADGGQVFLTAQAAGDLLHTAVNNTGVIQAQTLQNRNGVIKLLGDMQSGTVNVGGTLDASAPNVGSGGNGGFIETSAAHVNIAPDAKVTTAAANGLTGSWLIDPADFTIAATGGNITGATLNTALGLGAVTITTATGGTSCTGATCTAGTGTNGDIFVNDTVTWSANTALTLNAFRNININSSITSTGATGSLSLLYGQGAVAAGNTATYNVNAAVNLAAGANFSTNLGWDGALKNYTVITALGAAGSVNGTDLQGIGGGLTGNYVLGANIDATATSGWNSNAGFMPIGNNTTNFTGSFDGLGHTISNLSINRPSTNHVGLFGKISSTGAIRNVGMVGGSVTGSTYVGGLVGWNYGSISNSYATGWVSSGGWNIGGLVGLNKGGTISNSYATGAVSGPHRPGGLVGNNDGGSTISNSYATGAVSGTTNVGGLVGYNDGTGSISNSYWDTTTSGMATSAGGTGRTTTQMKDQANKATNFAGFDFTTTPVWGFSAGGNSGYPVLCAFGGCVSLVITVYVGPVTGSSIYGTAPVFTYTLVDSTGAAYSLTDATITGTATYSSAPTATSIVGNYSFSYGNGFTLTGTGASNYLLAPWATTTAWTVNKAPLTVTANAASKSYNGLAYSGGNGVAYTGFVNNETSAVFGGTLAYGGTSQGAINAARYTLTPSGYTSGNYSFNYADGALTVNKAAATVTANSGTGTYSGVSQSVSGFTASGLVNGEATTVLNGVTAGGSGTNANTYTSIASGTDGNYSLSFVPGTLAIAKAQLTVSADNQTKVYGAANPTLTETITGFVNNETSAVVNGMASGTSTAGSSTGVGTAAIAANATGLSAANYNFTHLVDGTLTINPNLAQDGAIATVAALTASVLVEGNRVEAQPRSETQRAVAYRSKDANPNDLKEINLEIIKRGIKLPPGIKLSALTEN